MEDKIVIGPNISIDTWLTELLEVKPAQTSQDISFEAQIKLLEQEQISHVSTDLSFDTQVQLMEKERQQELLGPKLPSTLYHTKKSHSTPNKITMSKIFNTSIPIIPIGNASLDSTQ